MSTWNPTQWQQAHSSGIEAAQARRIVVVYPCKAQHNPLGHEHMTQSELAKRLAAIKRVDYAGEFDTAYRYDAPLYFVPNRTLVTFDLANTLGIRETHDLFGGVVPHAFVATKVITHPLPSTDAYAPPGWSFEFVQRVKDVVLPGFSAFTRQDARYAAELLLEKGPVRLKKASSSGGLGQYVVVSIDELDDKLSLIDEEELRHDGVVLEQNLNDVATRSVGQVRVGDLLTTYYGTQKLTPNNSGEDVYGGSNLTVVRGDFDALLRLGLDRKAHIAIAQARIYHDAAMHCFSGMFASRCNYDVAQGLDQEGNWHSGVLEQSWRIGGASGAEVAALNAFRSDPTLNVVNASTTEVYGMNPAMPHGADVYFQGIDAHVGPLIKYAQLESYVDT
jgi:hypothetical protein